MEKDRYPFTGPVSRFVRRFVQELVIHPFLKLHVFGQENLKIIEKGPVILPYAPHTGHGDSIAIAVALNENGVNKLAIPGAADYWFTSLPKSMFASLLMPVFPLPRPDHALNKNNPQAGLREAYEKQIDLVNQGLSIFLAAEGTRSSKPPEDRKFKSAFAHLALATGAPIIPVTIVGYETVLPRGTAIPRPFDRQIPGLDKRKAIEVVFGDPIITKDMEKTSDNQDFLVANLQEIFLATYHQYADKKIATL